MIQHIIFNRLSLLLPVIFIINGCATSMSLRYEKPSFEMMNKEKISVVVDDQRPSGEGGNDPTRVGTIRNNFGMPFPLRASAGREPTKVLKELFSDCLKAAGYEVVEQAEPVPQMNVLLKSFWCDGYQYNSVWMTMSLELKSSKQDKPLWTLDFESSDGIVWTAGYGPFDEGFNRMLEKAKQSLITHFKDLKFQSSFKSL